MATKLTLTMKTLITLMEQNGGVILRYPGGFWAEPGWEKTWDSAYFTIQSIRALVERGLAEYTEWQGDPPFPVAARLTPKGEV